MRTLKRLDRLERRFLPRPRMWVLFLCQDGTVHLNSVRYPNLEAARRCANIGEQDLVVLFKRQGESFAGESDEGTGT